MSFSAVPNIPSTATVAGDGWYPDVLVGDFQKLYRLPQEYAADLVADHLALAALWAQRQLGAWRQNQEASGHATLEAVGQNATLLYRRAVFCHAKALLLGQFATVERRDAAKNDAKESPETAAMFYAWAQDAIADVLERGRIDVALI